MPRLISSPRFEAAKLHGASQDEIKGAILTADAVNHPPISAFERLEELQATGQLFFWHSCWKDSGRLRGWSNEQQLELHHGKHGVSWTARGRVLHYDGGNGNAAVFLAS